MKKKIELNIECPACGGSGLYHGMAEGLGTAVICNKCKGTGEYLFTYSYSNFTGQKKLETVQRVFLTGTRFKLGLGVINFDGIGPIDMDKEGVSYQEFLTGKVPQHIKKLGCPMLADQGACHEIKGFTERCNELHGGWLSLISDCKNKSNMDECWEKFDQA